MTHHAYETNPAGDVVYFDAAPLADIGDPETEAYLIELFLEQAATRLPELTHAVNAGDGEGLRRLAHGLKGSAATVGAVQMAAVCEDLCRLAGDGGPEAAAINRRLSAVLTRTSTAMTRHLASLTVGADPEPL